MFRAGVFSVVTVLVCAGVGRAEEITLLGSPWSWHTPAGCVMTNRGALLAGNFFHELNQPGHSSGGDIGLMNVGVGGGIISTVSKGSYSDDYYVTLESVGLTPLYLAGDFDHDGTIDAADCVLAGGYVPQITASSAAAVPEPACLGLLAIAATGLLRRR